jgi:hypothetical protein
MGGGGIVRPVALFLFNIAREQKSLTTPGLEQRSAIPSFFKNLSKETMLM